VGWRLGSFPVMKDGVELAVTGVMASVSFVRRFSKNVKAPGLAIGVFVLILLYGVETPVKVFDLFLSLC
jgi:hypothetical protein